MIKVSIIITCSLLGMDFSIYLRTISSIFYTLTLYLKHALKHWAGFYS
jgi:hypothetical protein